MPKYDWNRTVEPYRLPDEDPDHCYMRIYEQYASCNETDKLGDLLGIRSDAVRNRATIIRRRLNPEEKSIHMNYLEQLKSYLQELHTIYADDITYEQFHAWLHTRTGQRFLLSMQGK